MCKPDSSLLHRCGNIILYYTHGLFHSLPCSDELVGCTALHIAAYEGHAEIVSLLIKAHAPLEAKDLRGVSARG